MDAHSSFWRHHVLQHLKNCSSVFALSMILFFPTTQAFAEDSILSRFTRSIVDVYTSSQSCSTALDPGPSEYSKLITEYFERLYPNGVGYWVYPSVKQHISDYTFCTRLMQTNISEYQRARYDYTSNYPDKLLPPVLVAYRWDSKPVITPPAPRFSYQPAPAKNSDGQSFKSSK